MSIFIFRFPLFLSPFLFLFFTSFKKKFRYHMGNSSRKRIENSNIKEFKSQMGNSRVKKFKSHMGNWNLKKFRCEKENYNLKKFRSHTGKKWRKILLGKNEMALEEKKTVSKTAQDRGQKYLTIWFTRFILTTKKMGSIFKCELAPLALLRI